MAAMSLKKYNLVFIHILGWIIFLIIQFFLFSELKPDLGENRPNPNKQPHSIPFFPFLLILINILPYAIVFYLNYSVLIPKFYLRKKYVHYFLFALFMLACIFLFPILIRLNFPPPAREAQLPGIGSYAFQFFFKATTIIRCLLLVFAFLFSLFLKISISHQEAEKRRSKAELSLLKSQINPHFLFNALNSIYALSLKSSSKVSEYILELASMLRYSMTENPLNTIPLNVEVDYINNYISLQKLRLADNIKVEYSVSGDMDNKVIAPIILIAFIENCFKHGVSMDKETTIKINLKIERSKLELTTENRIFRYSNPEDFTNIGIKNTKERLELLYPNKYDLSLDAENDIYKVNLVIII